MTLADMVLQEVSQADPMRMFGTWLGRLDLYCDARGSRPERSRLMQPTWNDETELLLWQRRYAALVERAAPLVAVPYDRNAARVEAHRERLRAALEDIDACIYRPEGEQPQAEEATEFPPPTTWRDIARMFLWLVLGLAAFFVYGFWPRH